MVVINLVIDLSLIPDRTGIRPPSKEKFSMLVSRKVRWSCTQMHQALFLHGSEKLSSPHHLGAVAEACLSKRLHVKDVNSGLNFLIDSGSEVSIIPGKNDHEYNPINWVLVAANSTPIRILGKAELTLDLRLKSPFKCKFCASSLLYPILGVDV